MENHKHKEVYFETIQYIICKTDYSNNSRAVIAKFDDIDEAEKKFVELKNRGITCDILEKVTSGVAKYDVFFTPFKFTKYKL